MPQSLCFDNNVVRNNPPKSSRGAPRNIRMNEVPPLPPPRRLVLVLGKSENDVMKPPAPKNPLVFILAAGIFPLAGPIQAGTASPTPTAVVSKPGAQATPAVSSQPQAGKNVDSSPILRKSTPKKKKTPILEPLGLYDNPEFSQPLLDYNKLNADLYPILSDRPHTPTPDEKAWGTAAAIAGYSMAGAAAAQSLGLLPNDRIKKNK